MICFRLVQIQLVLVCTAIEQQNNKDFTQRWILDNPLCNCWNTSRPVTWLENSWILTWQPFHWAPWGSCEPGPTGWGCPTGDPGGAASWPVTGWLGAKPPVPAPGGKGCCWPGRTPGWTTEGGGRGGWGGGEEEKNKDKTRGNIMDVTGVCSGVLVFNAFTSLFVSSL